MPRVFHRVRAGYPSYLTQAYLRRLRGDFCMQRSNAKDRGIGFRFSFSEWLELWIASGKLKRRGRRRGQYVMARIGDRGAYAVRNVEIILHAENVRQFHRGKIVSEETRCLMSLAARLQWQSRREAARLEARP